MVTFPMLFAPLLASVVPATPELVVAPVRETATGTWEIELATPLDGAPSGPAVARMGLWAADGPGAGESGLQGGFRLNDWTGWLEGSWEGETRLELVITFDSGSDSRLVLEPAAAGAWTGSLVMDDFQSAVTARRVGEAVDLDLRLDVDFSVERPATVEREGLPEEWSVPIEAVVREELDLQRVVGLSLAIALDGEVVEVRSYGWQDFGRRIPVSAETRYRWASISKPLAATAILQLAEQGKLDLDRDAREYVPEFPEKQWIVTTRKLLGHQAGIVHYQHGPSRTEREYDDPNPFRDGILALDLFKESPLLFEPGTAYSYSTHGYVVAGAVAVRADGRPLADQVRERIAEPLGMTTLGPDFHQSMEIPDQTVGYVAISSERTIDSGDSNVAWKLAGGGFLSNVEDLALFGAGLAGGQLLEPETLQTMSTSGTLADGSRTGYGLGLRVGEMLGFRTISHGGSQRKTRTYLVLVPELGLGVAVMCNTEGTNTSRIADRILRTLLET